MISVEQALDHCLALVSPLEIEDVPLQAAAGRYLAQTLTARRDQPPFSASAMDGYALACHPQIGERFTVIGEAGAGRAWPGQIGPDQACRIFTGAPIPTGTLRVVIQEDVSREGDVITLKAGADQGTHIRPAGQDFRRGYQIGPKLLRANDLGLIAAMNIARVPVSRKPVVALIATGDELMMPGEAPAPDQILASSIFTLKAMIEAEGGKARILPIARDTESALETVLGLAQGADVIVTMGGASVGDHDLVAKVAQSLGLDQKFWRIAMRPGKPLMAGKLGDAAFLGLPGNPVSAVVCAHLFLLPMLRAALGQPKDQHAPPQLHAVLREDLPENGIRAHYMRATVTPGASLPRITALSNQDSSLLTLLAESNALLIRPVNDPARSAGAQVRYIAI